MKNINLRTLLQLAIALILIMQLGEASGKGNQSAIFAPVLKWQYGGCYSSWCETGWYSSPAVIDLEGDGAKEVIGSAYSIFVLEGETGSLKWQIASGHDRSEPEADSVGRTWPGIVVTDMDNDGGMEFVTAHSGGTVSVYSSDGYFEPGWPQHPISNELRGLSVFDLDQDGTLEVIVTGAVYNEVNTWVYEHNGLLRSGWPQLSNDSGYAHGIFNSNAAVGDIDQDGLGEIIAPSDVHYICAYESDGTQIPAKPVYSGKGWGRVGVWESLDIELRGWGACDGVRAESYRANFAHGASAIADMNNDGQNEVIAVGNMYDCSTDPYSSRYNGVFIFNADRSRFTEDGFDWRSIPTDTGGPLSEDYNQVENNQPNPAIGDLDGDGILEIVYSSYDGRVHAFWLDKTEHGSWPYSVLRSGEGIIRFASEPIIVDLDVDGFAEVLFTSWVEKGTYMTGKLHILDYLGNPIHEVDLPTAYGSPSWNGALAAPTIDNIDGDADLEVVINTAHSGLVAYDLPGSAGASIYWGTGRGNYLRNGVYSAGPEATLDGSTKTSDRNLVEPGDLLTYTILLNNPGKNLTNVNLTDNLPGEVSYSGSLTASSGTAQYLNGVVSWTGDVAAGKDVIISFNVQIDSQITQTVGIVNSITIADKNNRSWEKHNLVIVNGFAQYLPMIR